MTEDEKQLIKVMRRVSEEEYKPSEVKDYNIDKAGVPPLPFEDRHGIFNVESPESIKQRRNGFNRRIKLDKIKKEKEDRRNQKVYN